MSLPKLVSILRLRSFEYFHFGKKYSRVFHLYWLLNVNSSLRRSYNDHNFYKSTLNITVQTILKCPFDRCEAVAANKTRRPLVQQMHDSKIKFPLPCRVQKQAGGLVVANRPKTYFQ